MQLVQVMWQPLHELHFCHIPVTCRNGYGNVTGNNLVTRARTRVTRTYKPVPITTGMGSHRFRGFGNPHRFHICSVYLYHYILQDSRLQNNVKAVREFLFPLLYLWQQSSSTEILLINKTQPTPGAKAEECPCRVNRELIANMG